ncbi:MAG: HAMP domain-containing histidine kinase [Clostridia bacterium]|nr:HAMP domain-containing histidine kinase [Clostridia bacterium]
MIKKLQIRFILFAMIAITLVLGTVSTIFLMGTPSNATQHRTVMLLMVILVLVLAASITLSYIAVKPIKKAWQQQLDFTADASHELRTPLAVIQSNLELVMDNEEETVESQERWLGNIHKELIRMNHLVEDLLTLSRADSNVTELTVCDVPLEIVLEERACAFEQLAAAKEIKIERTMEQNLIMKGDIDRIQQLFTILFDNSIKYMGRPGTIKINAYKNKNQLHIDYMDDGTGIPDDEVEHVFKRFYRVDKARSRSQNGSGLGLSIAEWIVRSHEGKIELKCGVDQGVHFHITFPKQKNTV